MILLLWGKREARCQMNRGKHSVFLSVEMNHVDENQKDFRFKCIEKKTGLNDLSDRNTSG